MINRSNYEIYFIDQFDGKLDKDQMAELNTFLFNNPDLREEFELFKEMKTDPDLKISFASKERLKKDTITYFNYKTWLARYFENELTNDQRNEVKIFINKDADLAFEFELLIKSRLEPDHAIIFPNKKALRKTNKVIVFGPAVKRTLSIAAALVILLLAYFLIQQLRTPSSEMAAQNEKKVDSLNQHTDVRVKISSGPTAKIPSTVQNTIAEHKLVQQTRVQSVDNHKIQKDSDPVEVNRSTAENKIKEKAIDDGKVIEDKSGDSSIIGPIEDVEPTAENISLKNTDVRISINNKVNPITIKQVVIPQMTLSDIFNEDELVEIKKNKINDGSAVRSNATTILNLATKRLLQIAKSADVMADKKTDDETNTVTYAVAIGKNFSVSHTTSK